jgi:hypothetical protein
MRRIDDAAGCFELLPARLISLDSSAGYASWEDDETQKGGLIRAALALCAGRSERAALHDRDGNLGAAWND